MKLHAFMTDKSLCGAEFRGDSWRSWRVVARLFDGDAHLLKGEELALAYQLTGLDVLPQEAPLEIYGIAGRRSGKSRFSSIALTHAAAQDYRDMLAPGEWATALCIATDRKQARVIFGYTEALIDGSDMLRSAVVSSNKECIEFSHRSRIEIHTASFRAVRGYTVPLAILDEAAFLRDERSSTPDVEIARALKPALMTLGGRLLVISSPHRKLGLLWNKYKRHHGSAQKVAA